ncbi:MAG: 4Fe-4S binding protein [Proteobacteria bacterium]|nr:4Fe-4S binding protein [Pseudomonadota bacterium]
MSKDVYRVLQEYLDSLPVGYPRTESGVELEILKKLFEPEEAEMAVKLTLVPETPDAFGRRVGLSAETAGERLEAMARKGQIFRMRKGDQALYNASPFVPGIYEYQLNNLDRELVGLIDRYFDEALGRIISSNRIPVFRALPLDENLLGMDVMPYEQAREIIKAQTAIVLTDCICRKERRISGHGCSHVDDVCMVFSHMARYYAENGLGRLVSVEEALDALERADRDGLVHSPNNAQRPMGFCNCCGCCCGLLRSITQHGYEPGRVIRSDFRCQSDPEACTGCEVCLERCMFGAIEMIDEAARVDSSKCIGCGVCVSTCPADALKMERKSGEEMLAVPASLSELFIEILKDDGPR